MSQRLSELYAVESFEKFCAASTMRQCLAHFREMCDLLELQPTHITNFYPILKVKLSKSWKAQAVFKKLDSKYNSKVYNGGKVCSNTSVLVIGGGPCGLRTAIDAQLLGAKVVVIEKRDRMSRNNVLHLWPFVIEDLRQLAAKKFYGKFCAGSIDHISIRQLQLVLIKAALLLGVTFHQGVQYDDLIEPTDEFGWRARVTPEDHPVSKFEFDMLIGADGKRNTLRGFNRKEFRGKRAIAITANFINFHTKQEASVPEISGTSFIFNQSFFKELSEKHRIDLENLVYYKDETHYIVMTGKKNSLLERGVLKQDYPETRFLLAESNIDMELLKQYVIDTVLYATHDKLSRLEFAVNHYGRADVCIFDFTTMHASENASRVLERAGRRLLVQLVGDSLLEPFWPTGSGCARGFLSSLDACWALRQWGLGLHPLSVLAERESIYRILAQTSPSTLHGDIRNYSVDPTTRYVSLNRAAASPHQVAHLYTTDAALDLLSIDLTPRLPAPPPPQVPGLCLIPDPMEDLTFMESSLVTDKSESYHTHDTSRKRRSTTKKSETPRRSTTHDKRRTVPKFPKVDNLRKLYDKLRKSMNSTDEPEKQQRTARVAEKIILRQKQLFESEKMVSTYERDSVPAQNVQSQMCQISQKIQLIEDLLNSREVRHRDNTVDARKTNKKPGDLMRAIGLIESTDWQVKQLEQRMKEPQPSKNATEKVPKWDREQFIARQTKIISHGKNQNDEKFNVIDMSLKNLGKKLKDGSNLEVGERGNNKVANLAGQFAQKKPEEKAAAPKGSGKKPVTVATRRERCRGCRQPVYLAERVSPEEGLVLHRKCFKCCHCNASLTVRNYIYDRDWVEGLRVYCTASCKVKYASKHHPDTGCPTPPAGGGAREAHTVDSRDKTMENIDDFQTEATPIDEDVWQTRNFGSEYKSVPSDEDESSISDSDDDSEDFLSGVSEESHEESSEEEESDEEDSYGSWGSESGAALEQRKREVALTAAPPSVSATDTELPSETTSKNSNVANSETEVSTDSEFAVDRPGAEDHTGQGQAPPSVPPEVVPVQEVTARRPNFSRNHARKQDYLLNFQNQPGQPTMTPSKQGANQPGSMTPFKQGANKKIASPDNLAKQSSSDSSSSDEERLQEKTEKNNVVEKSEMVKEIDRVVMRSFLPQPLVIPWPGEYLLSRTKSTSGIATKKALELKKKYLLGPHVNISLQKSDSASELGSKFREFHSNISECQKLLNPAPDISPSMQAFLDSASRRTPGGLLSPSGVSKVSSIGTQPPIASYSLESVEPKQEKDSLRLSVSGSGSVSGSTGNQSVSPVSASSDSNLANLDTNLDNECSNGNENDATSQTFIAHHLKSQFKVSPSPILKINVPKIPWKEPSITDVDSDSLLSSERALSFGSSSEDLPNKRNTHLSVPRVEIMKPCGEIMQLDSLMIFDSKSGDCEDSDDDSTHGTHGEPPVAVAQSDSQKRSDIIEKFPCETKTGHNPALSSSDSGNDITAFFTDNEPLDWAVEGNSVDTFSLKNVRKTHDYDFYDKNQHVCGKGSEVRKNSLSILNRDHSDIDFMDTGSEESLLENEDSLVVNNINTGYMEFVDVDVDGDGEQYREESGAPHITEAVNEHCASDLNFDENFIEQGANILNKTTFESIPNNEENNSNEKCNANAQIKPQDDEKCADSGNLESSINTDLSSEKYSSDPPTKISINNNELTAAPFAENIEFNDNNKKSHKSPGTLKKLQELNLEKEKQKDVIHQLVMDKMSKRLDRRERRSRSPNLTLPVKDIDLKFKKLNDAENTVEQSAEQDGIREAKLEADQRLRNSPATKEKKGSLSYSTSFKLLEADSVQVKRPNNSETFSLPDIHQSLVDENEKQNLRNFQQSRNASVLGRDNKVDNTFASGIVPGFRQLSLNDFSGKLVQHVESLRNCPTDKESNLTGNSFGSLCSSDPNFLSPDGSKKSRARDSERRKSIIKTVSDFFSRRKDSPSHSNAASPEDRKGKFLHNHKLRTKSSEPPAAELPPPVPPLPANYFSPNITGGRESYFVDNNPSKRSVSPRKRCKSLNEIQAKVSEAERAEDILRGLQERNCSCGGRYGEGPRQPPVTPSPAQPPGAHEQLLQQRHEELRVQLRDLLNSGSDINHEKESAIINEMMAIVAQRQAIYSSPYS